MPDILTKSGAKCPSITRNKQILAWPAGFGLLLFFSWLSRRFVTGKILLFWLGFLTSFGIAFSLPLMVLMLLEPWTQTSAQKHLRQTCFATFLALLLHESFDLIRVGRVFDLLDIAASAAGALGAYFLFKTVLVQLLHFQADQPT